MRAGAQRQAKDQEVIVETWLDLRVHAHLDANEALRPNLVEAEAVQSELLATLRRRAPDNPQIAAALGELAATLIAEKKFTNAESVARECLEFRQKHYPDGWSAFSARTLLGESLLGQKKYGEAEPLLLSGYEGMEQRKDKIKSSGVYTRQPLLKKALELLVQLNDETGRPDQAAEWKKKLASQ